MAEGAVGVAAADVAGLRALARRQARAALDEDVGAGDLSAGLVAGGRMARATLLCKEDAVLCGRLWFEECFLLLDAAATFEWRAADGAAVAAGAEVCVVEGRAGALLTAERSAINFLQTLSGTATTARAWRRAVAASGGTAQVVDTRKTLPLLRAAQKYATRVGGVVNHRMGLWDEILVKENHAAAAGGLAAAVRAALAAAAARGLGAEKVQVEARSVEEMRAAVGAGARRVLLDNFSYAGLRAAVAAAEGLVGADGVAVELEASGNVSLDNVGAVAATGVARVSVGAITKHVRAVDFSLLLHLEQTEDGR